MRQRKVDDNKLLEMLRQGKLQKEIAEYFGVSPVAISKRVKRLLPQPIEVFNKYNLTPKQQKFVVEKAKGKTNTQAALSAYECKSLKNAKIIGSQLMADPDIKASIADLMASEGLTRRYRIQRLKEHIMSRDPLISLKGLDQSWKLDGYPVTREYDTGSHSFINIKIEIEPSMMNYIEPDTNQNETLLEDKESDG